MRRASHHEIQRDELAGIEQVIHARGKFRAVAVVGFFLDPFAAANFIVAVGKTAAGHADGKIGIRAEAVDETEFRIEIDRRDGQPQREVRAEKIRLVVVVISVAGHRRAAFRRLVVADLDEVALERVNLRRRGERKQECQPAQEKFDSPHRVFLKANPARGQARLAGQKT